MPRRSINVRSRCWHLGWLAAFCEGRMSFMVKMAEPQVRGPEANFTSGSRREKARRWGHGEVVKITESSINWGQHPGLHQSKRREMRADISYLLSTGINAIESSRSLTDNVRDKHKYSTDNDGLSQLSITLTLSLHKETICWEGKVRTTSMRGVTTPATVKGFERFCSQLRLKKPTTQYKNTIEKEGEIHPGARWFWRLIETRG